MGWHIVRVEDQAGRDEGTAIFCSTTGAFVRPLVGHPQSVFSEKVTEALAEVVRASELCGAEVRESVFPDSRIVYPKGVDIALRIKTSDLDTVTRQCQASPREKTYPPVPGVRK